MNSQLIYMTFLMMLFWILHKNTYSAHILILTHVYEYILFILLYLYNIPAQHVQRDAKFFFSLYHVLITVVRIVKY